MPPILISTLLCFIFQQVKPDTNVIDTTSPDQERKTVAKNVQYYWNIPTFQCDSHKINFTELAEKYDIIQNENDRFRGNEIAILYDPGNFPALLNDGSNQIRRNGGVPQEGNLTLHLTLFQAIMEELIPDEEFSGLGVIDFESWRPIFRQNFGTLTPYKDLSIDIEHQYHPFWPKTLLEKQARKRFELSAREFMEETLSLAKSLRGNATWGYYAYPYCFNMSPNNMKMTCPNDVLKENDRIDWLFRQSDALYPSLYLTSTLSAKDKVRMIQGRISEAQRMANFNRNQTPAKIIPYFWYKYHGGTTFVSKEDLNNSFMAIGKSGADGVVLWGSSNDVNTKNKCAELYKYIDTVLGPSIVNNTK